MEDNYITINVGNFIVGETTYSDRCLSASLGGNGILTNTIPWENTEYNPWDYRAEYEEVTEEIEDEEGNVSEETRKVYTGTFVFDPITLPTETPLPAVTVESRLDDLEIAVCEIFETMMM